ncbi:anthranilate synthase component 1 [Vibrio rhizosphaerae]|uniref:Anthranilate synthase component 1 n=1 Tax=Vibrio rhizosphaerae TaxID=398736 RepID=A0ABU4IV39_9VIBR|nr:anthranilate synthase component 1 [Vibrio rhizosphaerae]MDW6092783.1 anthranilate synthase component 1 [Vibrio rhizosphaerae]
MNNTIDITQLGTLRLLSETLPYSADPTAVFHTLCGDKSDCLLLESAEIDSKADLKSLLLIDAAVRVICFGHEVTFHALTPNGEHLIHHLLQNIKPEVTRTQTERTLTLHFDAPRAGLDEDSRLQQSSSFDALRLIQHSFDLTGLDKHAIFLGGLFAYDLVANFEPLGDAQATNQCPDYVFYVAESLMIIDHQNGSCHVQGSLFNPDEQTTASLSQRLKSIVRQCQDIQPLPSAVVCDDVTVSPSMSDAEFCDVVQNLKQYIVQGDIFQVVPSRRFILPCPSPLAAYKKLKATNPSPYMFYIQDEKFTLFGASPESALKYASETNQIEIYPIAGTRPRGKNPDGSINFDLDGRLELDLRNDKKENAEHMMLVDLARNDVARISEAGTRHLADLLKTDRYSHVMHLVSRVVGQLRHDLDALHAYQACMNMGTLTGAPKIRAMQLIRTVEQERRGSYGGAVGYMTGEGDLDTCIVIRSAYIEDGIASVQAGAGVVYDSDPQSEADETRGKAQAVIAAIQLAHQPSDRSVQGEKRHG